MKFCVIMIRPPAAACPLRWFFRKPDFAPDLLFSRCVARDEIFFVPWLKNQFFFILYWRKNNLFFTKKYVKIYGDVLVPILREVLRFFWDFQRKETHKCFHPLMYGQRS